MSKASWMTYITFAIIFMQILAVSNAERLTKENKELLKKVTELLSSYQPTMSAIDESSIERTDRLNRAMERAMEFVNVIGQLDSFINDKARVFLKKLNAMYDVEEAY